MKNQRTMMGAILMASLAVPWSAASAQQAAAQQAAAPPVAKVPMKSTNRAQAPADAPAQARRERGERVLKQLTRSDRLPPHFLQLREEFPELADLTLTYALGDIWGREVLDPKTRQLVSLAGFAAQGTLPQFKVHAQYALNLGVTPQELMEVVYITTVTSGSPRALAAAATLKELFGENNITLPLGRAQKTATPQNIRPDPEKLPSRK